MRLECPQCAVRDWSPSDKDALVRAANNRRIWRNMTDMFYSRVDCIERQAGSTEEGAR